MASSSVRVVSLRGGPRLSLVGAGGLSSAAIWPGMGAKLRSIHYVELSAGIGTIRLEHPSDSVYYVMTGSGQVVGDNVADVHEVIEGSMVHIDRGTGYRFRAGGHGMTLFGGPCPVDPTMYNSHAQP